MPARKWSEAKTEKLLALWGKEPVEKIAEKLRVSVATVRARARKLGLYGTKAAQVKYHPAAEELVLEFWEQHLETLKKMIQRLEKWIDRLEEQRESEGRIKSSDLIAVAKAVDSLRAIVADIAKYAKVIGEKQKVTQNITVNLNLYKLVQVANRVMEPEQRKLFIEELQKEGLIEEVLKP